jgi:hypothetical protein
MSHSISQSAIGEFNLLKHRVDFGLNWYDLGRRVQKDFQLPKKLYNSMKINLLQTLRRLRDSNPRYPLEVYTLSRRAPSTTRTSLHYNKKHQGH